jgi:uncharacterized protein YdeI (YjbR/CyaY-like superfamily)
MTPIFFETAADFRTWLEHNHASATELIVGLRKLATGRASMTWSESVDEALCFGWIDGVRKRIDDASYQIRFTPRKSGSIWSQVNVEKVKVLLLAGRMRPAGIAAHEARTEARTGIYAFERNKAAELSAAETKNFQQNNVAWNYFESCPPSYKRVMLHWVVSAKQAPTRDRRLSQLIQACAEQKRILK